ncbi:EndoU domain-containing protein [Paenibacillus sp. FSL W8-1187]|uniref:EndoU domain-containing protein n=1 Tax=Paenibacillus sp. FSL W8-1187 TaxID=2975339 RepID=UPI0030DC854D
MIGQRMKWRSGLRSHAERLLGGAGRWLAKHPYVLHLYALLSWAALLYFLSTLFFYPESRKLGVQYLWSIYVLLQFWWLCRSKTLSWRSVMLFFLAGAWLIVPLTGFAVSLLTAWTGSDTGDLWSRALLTPIAEEVVKLLPLAAYLLFSRRASALSLGDYALIGGAVGAGFQFMEETARRWTTGHIFPYGYSWISGKFIHWNVGELFPGYLQLTRGPAYISYSHAMLGSLAALGVGLAIRFRGKLRGAAPAVPAALLALAIFDHAAYNASYDLPDILQWIGDWTGNGHATKPLYLLLLAGAVGYDYVQLNRIRDRLPMLERERWLDPLSELARSGAALFFRRGRFREQLTFFRERKRLGCTLLYGNEEALGAEPDIRRETRRLAALLGAAALLLAAASLHLHALLQAPDAAHGCFACMFEDLQQWWDRRSFWEKTAMAAGMLALSLLFLELWPAIGLISTVTGLFGSGATIGAFLRDPRSFLTPGRLAALGVDLALSRIPLGRLAERIPGRFGEWLRKHLDVRTVEYDIAKLQNTSRFRAGALEHILDGELNRRGRGVGYHYEGMPTARGRVIPGTESPPNAHGVYQAQVEIDGVPKTGNQGMSTFFPKDMSPQQIVDSINEAFANQRHVTGNTYTGTTSSGMRIDMYLDRSGSIISAFPHY